MKRTIISAIVALFAAITFAQSDSLNAVVNVENDYNPIIVKAVKQSFTPQIEMPTDNTPLDLVFSRSATPFERFVSNRDLSNLLPAQETLYNGYARLGYGNYNNVDAKLVKQQYSEYLIISMYNFLSDALVKSFVPSCLLSRK